MHVHVFLIPLRRRRCRFLLVLTAERETAPPPDLQLEHVSQKSGSDLARRVSEKAEKKKGAVFQPVFLFKCKCLREINKSSV